MSTDGPPRLAETASPVDNAVQSLAIVLLVRALGFGGAERQVVYLANGLARRGHRVTVASFYPGGAFEGELSGDNLEKLVIGKKGRSDVLGFLWRLRRAITARQPDVVYSFLPVPNLLAAAAPIPSRYRPAVVWGVRGTPLDLGHYGWLERASIRLERLASGLPDLVIANSRSGAEWAKGPKFRARPVAMVANGIDTDRFRPPSPDERAAARLAVGCPEETVIVAVVGRLDPMKDHPTFLKALAGASRAAPQLTALIVGDGPGAAVARLRATASALGVADRVIWADARREVAQIYHAADLLCLPSAFGEGFPNVVGEAMASGLSCIVTAVGDSAELVGTTGTVVPPREPEALARAMLDYAKAIRESCPHNPAPRRRIVAHFGIKAMVSATERLLLQVAAGRGRAGK